MNDLEEFDVVSAHDPELSEWIRGHGDRSALPSSSSAEVKRPSVSFMEALEDEDDDVFLEYNFLQDCRSTAVAFRIAEEENTIRRRLICSMWPHRLADLTACFHLSQPSVPLALTRVESQSFSGIQSIIRGTMEREGELESRASRRKRMRMEQLQGDCDHKNINSGLEENIYLDPFSTNSTENSHRSAAVSEAVEAALEVSAILQEVALGRVCGCVQLEEEDESERSRGDGDGQQEEEAAAGRSANAQNLPGETLEKFERNLGLSAAGALPDRAAYEPHEGGRKCILEEEPMVSLPRRKGTRTCVRSGRGVREQAGDEAAVAAWVVIEQLLRLRTNARGRRAAALDLGLEQTCKVSDVSLTQMKSFRQPKKRKSRASRMRQEQMVEKGQQFEDEVDQDKQQQQPQQQETKETAMAQQQQQKQLHPAVEGDKRHMLTENPQSHQNYDRNSEQEWERVLCLMEQLPFVSGNTCTRIRQRILQYRQ